MKNEELWHVAINRSFDVNGNAQNPNFFGTQKDWMQCMVTLINEISAQIHMSTSSSDYKGEPRPANTCLTSVKNKKLFEMLEYYKPKTQKLGTRFKIKFQKYMPTNIILVFDSKQPSHCGTLMLFKSK